MSPEGVRTRCIVTDASYARRFARNDGDVCRASRVSQALSAPCTIGNSSWCRCQRNGRSITCWRLPVTGQAFDVPRRLFDVQHRFIELDGARIHYVDEGEGETLLLLHGNPSWSFLYRKIIAALRGEFRCVALDFPGYGLSDPAPGY